MSYTFEYTTTQHVGFARPNAWSRKYARQSLKLSMGSFLLPPVVVILASPLLLESDMGRWENCLLLMGLGAAPGVLMAVTALAMLVRKPVGNLPWKVGMAALAVHGGLLMVNMAIVLKSVI